MRAVVTGGTGFLGRRVAELLLDEGNEVTCVGRRRIPDLAVPTEYIMGDIRDPVTVSTALQGADVVFHLAARVGHWGPKREFQSVNVEGTRAMLAAARQCGVRRFVHTSTASVIGYDRDVEGGRALPVKAGRYESAYVETKAAAERLVLAANSAEIATVVLRPHLVIGPGDRDMMPGIVRAAAAGRLRVIGDGTNRVDLTYIDNAAWAHLDAARALTGPDSPCAGRPYFISNGEPILLWEWLNEVLENLGLQRAARPIPLGRARLLGALAEGTWAALRLRGEPPVTRLLASALARSHWFDITPARRDFGYHIRVTNDEGTRRTIEWLKATVPDPGSRRSNARHPQAVHRHRPWRGG